MNSAQLVYEEVQNLPIQQVQQVLDFIDFLKFKTAKYEKFEMEIEADKPEHLPISHYVGMIKIPKTNVSRSLFDFDPASIATDDR